MPVPSLPTELLEDILDIVYGQFTLLGEVGDFARNVTLVNRRWTPIGRRILWRELALQMSGKGLVYFAEHLEVYPHLAEFVEYLTLFRDDPSEEAARAVEWEDSQMNSLLEIVRRCQNLVSLHCHFIPDNEGNGFVPVRNVEKPFYDLFEATSKERFEIFWPELTLKRFASILVPGFPALQELKLSIGEFSGHELGQYSDYDPTMELAAGIVQSPVEVLTVTLGGAPTVMCRILGRAINPSVLTQLFCHGNGISNYDELPQWIASFPALERLSLRLRGKEQQEVLPALSTALAGLEYLEEVLIRRNWDKWDDSKSRGEHYWSPVPLKELLGRMPPQCTMFILEGLVFPSRQIEEFGSFKCEVIPDHEGCFLGHMVRRDRSSQSFQMLLGSVHWQPDPDWCWVKDVRFNFSLIMLF